MYLRVFKFLILIILLSFSELKAQRFTTSPYSRYGIGDIFSGATGHNIAMGGAGIAESTPYFLNTVNPAANTDLLLQRFVFDVGFDVKYTKTESEVQNQKNSSATFRYFAGGFAVKPWWSFTFSMSPYSAVGYLCKDTVNVKSGDYTRKYAEYFQGKGGLSEVSLGTSFKILKMFSVGVKGKYVFGDIEREDSLNTIASDYTSKTIFKNEEIIRGFTADFGFLAQKSFTSKKDSSKTFLKLAAGVYFSGNTKLNTRSQLTMFSRNSLVGSTDTIANDTLYDGKITIPKSFGIGISAEFFEQLRINMDYRFQDWTNFEMPVEKNASCFKENKYYGMGIQYVNAKYSSRYYKTINYRFGIHKCDTYLKLNGYDIQEKGISFGLGFPIRTLLLNVSCDFGTRGTTDGGLYKEKYFLMHFNVTAHDIWFVKRKFQ
ncbi:MAG: hypothetical protein K5685_02005 [Bacteroidales bacterium]|nr:hypothetical protein [Bacteroidales bacterium]